MKKYIAFLLCVLLCVTAAAAQAEGFYGSMGGQYELAGAYDMSGGLSAYDMTDMAAYGMTGAAPAYGFTETSAAYGMPASYPGPVSAPGCGVSVPSVGCGTAVMPPVYSVYPAPAAFREFTGYVNGYRINVRSCPGTSGTVCGVVSYGDVIHVTNQTYVSGNKLWYYGSIGCLCGWIYSGYVGGVPLTASCPVVTSCAVPNGYGTICMNGTNFRTGPGLCYASLMQLKRGTMVQLLCAVSDGSGTVWYQVLSGGFTGWVRSDLITTVGCAGYGPVTPYTCTASFTGYTNMNAVNVRVTPNGSVITQVCRGTTVYVYGIVCQGGVYWYQIRFYGGVGYIRADLVTACTYPYPSPGCGTGVVGKSGGINYYDYSNKSTTIITENPPAGPSCGSAMPDTGYGYPAPSTEYADPSYGMNGSAGDFGKALGDAAPGQTYFPDVGSYSPEAANLPAPAAQPASLCFTTCSLTAGQTLPVYTAPNTESLRADSGTAQVTLTESIYAAGFDGQWLLVMYRNQDKMTRVGYLNAFQLQGTLPSMASIAFGTQQVMASCRTAVTSDPMEQTDALMMLNSGDTVTLLATLNLNGQWAYVETMYNGVIVRGFVPADAVRVSTDRIEQG